MTFRYMVTTQAPPRPMLCDIAILAPSTWRFSAWPRSCQTISEHCASPVAPSGCPLEISPLYAADAEELKSRIEPGWQPTFPLVLEE